MTELSATISDFKERFIRLNRKWNNEILPTFKNNANNELVNLENKQRREYTLTEITRPKPYCNLYTQLQQLEKTRNYFADHVLTIAK